MSEFSKELCNERSIQAQKRLDKHDDTLDALKTCSVKLTEIVEMHSERLLDHESRIDDLEKRPSSILSKIVDGIISAVVAALVCMVL